MGMSIIRKARRQKAVYWGAPTSDGRGGKQTILPVEIDCRWTDTQQQIRTTAGEEILSMSMIMTDRDVDEGGFLLLGTLDSLGDKRDSAPQEITGAHEIRKFQSLPVLRVRLDGLDPNADEYLRQAWL